MYTMEELYEMGLELDCHLSFWTMGKKSVEIGTFGPMEYDSYVFLSINALSLIQATITVNNNGQDRETTGFPTLEERLRSVYLPKGSTVKYSIESQSRLINRFGVYVHMVRADAPLTAIWKDR